jgi:adenosylcobyric acid synthase
VWRRSRRRTCRSNGSAAGLVCGTYLHGLFDHPALRGAFLNRLRAERGLPVRESVAPPIDDHIDRLADHVESHLDAGLLERIVGLERSQLPRQVTFPVTP